MADDIAVTLKSADYHLRIENVDTQPAWRETYGPRVPVLTDESGTEICAVRLDASALSAAIGVRTGR